MLLALGGAALVGPACSRSVWVKAHRRRLMNTDRCAALASMAWELRGRTTGVDCDHIAAIDNVARARGAATRRLVGLWFSLGHSTVVVLLCAAVSMGWRAAGDIDVVGDGGRGRGRRRVVDHARHYWRDQPGGRRVAVPAAGARRRRGNDPATAAAPAADRRRRRRGSEGRGRRLPRGLRLPVRAGPRRRAWKGAPSGSLAWADVGVGLLALAALGGAGAADGVPAVLVMLLPALLAAAWPSSTRRRVARAPRARQGRRRGRRRAAPGLQADGRERVGLARHRPRDAGGLLARCWPATFGPLAAVAGAGRAHDGRRADDRGALRRGARRGAVRPSLPTVLRVARLASSSLPLCKNGPVFCSLSALLSGP